MWWTFKEANPAGCSYSCSHPPWSSFDHHQLLFLGGLVGDPCFINWNFISTTTFIKYYCWWEHIWEEKDIWSNVYHICKRKVGSSDSVRLSFVSGSPPGLCSVAWACPSTSSSWNFKIETWNIENHHTVGLWEFNTNIVKSTSDLSCLFFSPRSFSCQFTQKLLYDVNLEGE